MYDREDSDIGNKSLNLTSIFLVFLLVKIDNVASENIPPWLGAENFYLPASPSTELFDVGNLSAPACNRFLNSE